MHTARWHRSTTIGMSWLTSRKVAPCAWRARMNAAIDVAHHRVHRGERLVEHRHARRLDEAHAELEQLALAARELAGVEVLHRPERQLLDQRVGARVGLGLGEAAREAGGQQVVERATCARRRASSGTCAARRAAPAGSPAQPVMSRRSIGTRPASRREEAGEQVQHRRLARAVGADQAEDLALRAGRS